MNKLSNFREEKTEEGFGTKRDQGSILFGAFASAAGFSWLAALLFIIPDPWLNCRPSRW